MIRILSAILMVSLVHVAGLVRAESTAPNPTPKKSPRVYQSVQGPIRLDTLAMLMKYSTTGEPEVYVDKIRWTKNPVLYSKYIGSRLAGMTKFYYIVELTLLKRHRVECTMTLEVESESVEFSDCESETADVRELFLSLQIPFGSIGLNTSPIRRK